MINDFTKLFKKDSSSFVYPRYEDYSFANIPSTLLSLFGIRSKNPILPKELYEKPVSRIRAPIKVVLFLLDGFGFEQWRKAASVPLLDLFNKRGVVSSITAVFPSTTAAALTTLNSGLTPQEHGLPEWNVYFKEIDQIIETLPFRPLGETESDILLKKGLSPSLLFRGKTIHQTLQDSAVLSFSFSKKSYAHSAYSQVIHKGSTVIPFNEGHDLIPLLLDRLSKVNRPSLFTLYWDQLDSIEHGFGPYSKEYDKELLLVSQMIIEKFIKRMPKEVSETTLFLIISDHGHVPVDPKKTIYLNSLPALIESFQKSKKGKEILPSGSVRDVFLHIRPDKLEDIIKFLSSELKNKAKVVKISDALKMKLFGRGKPTRRFLERVGNVLILPYSGNTIWYEHIPGKKFEHLGHHGGLSFEEMVVPFAAARLSDLKKDF